MATLTVSKDEEKRLKGMGFLSNKGTDNFSARVITVNGKVTAAQQRCLAEAAEKFGNGILTFTLDDLHPHDVGEILAADGIAVRAGHHCAQPLLAHLGYRSTVRASFAFYNTIDDAEKFIDSLSTVRERMGYGK